MIDHLKSQKFFFCPKQEPGYFEVIRELRYSRNKLWKRIHSKETLLVVFLGL